MIDFLASLNLSVHLTSLPFESREDVLAVFPSYMREEVGDEVFDAIVDGLLAMSLKRASDLAELAAQANGVYAVGAALDLHGPSYDVARATGEEDEPYRDRLLNPGNSIDPTSILAGVKKIISPLTDADPWYAELPDDGAFITPADDTIEDGVYLEVDEGIEAPERRWGARPGARPRHWFLWGPSTPSISQISANLYGHGLIGIPAFPVPESGEDDDDDFWFGEEDGAYTFDLSTLGTYPEESNPLYAVESDALLIVDRVRRFLEQAVGFPNTFDIVLDPTLEA